MGQWRRLDGLTVGMQNDAIASTTGNVAGIPPVPPPPAAPAVVNLPAAKKFAAYWWPN